MSGLLNFIDGLWTSCTDERIIVFTTCYKDKLDPALLRPGKIIASNYLRIESHCLFTEIEQFIKQVKVTPEEVKERAYEN